MRIEFKPIGFVRNGAAEVPKHWTESDLEGELELLPQYQAGLADIKAGQQIAVLFHFHGSQNFNAAHLKQKKRGTGKIKGVFSICSPIRPNPIGHSVLSVLAVEGCRIRVKGLDMYDGTPILDIKPHHA